MATFTQTNRQLAVTTPLGKDVLLLAAFNGREEMSRLFHYELDLLSENVAVAAKDIVGKNVTFTVFRSEGTQRTFNGFVSRFSACNLRFRGMRQYRAQVVPWLWFLTRTADCRIFQKKTTPDILSQIFKDLGFTDYKLQLSASYVKRDYCVQYRETDFNFVSRLMEEEGIFYFFKHEDGKHTLVLADQASAYKDCAEKAVDYSPGSLVPNHVAQWDHQYEFRPGKYAQQDYNFETPSTSLMTNETTIVDVPGNTKYEVYDYPGLYMKTGEGRPLTKIHMEEEETPQDVVRGTSGCRTFSPGLKFTLTKHDCASEQGKSFVVTSIEHSAREGSYTTGDDKETAYTNQFTCIPSTVTFRPTRTTQKPAVKGTQTALVVGPKGEEIYTDKYGRIKVQFYWDREGKKDENSSCWIRVSQPWAGKRWGASFWPRIGQEVIVDFLEGDPDRPIIVGSVYNAEQMPPYLGDGADSKHKNDNKVSGIKTNSTKGGSGYNELRFDDTQDKQQVFLHAERNMDVRVKKDSMELVLGNRNLIVGSKEKPTDQRGLITQDKHLNIKRHQVEKIEGNWQFLVGKGDASGGNVDISIEKNQTETVGGEYDLHVTKDRKEKIDGTQSLTVGKDQQEKVGQNHALEAGMAVHMKAGTTLILEAGAQLSLKVGGNFIDISPAGVAIHGTMVLINSGGAAGSGAGAKPNAPQEAKEAKPTKPDEADDSASGNKSSS